MRGEQKHSLHRIRKNIQGMLSQARQITKQHMTLPPLLQQHVSHMQIHLSPNHQFNHQINFLLKEPSLQYRRINRGKEHYCISCKQNEREDEGEKEWNHKQRHSINLIDQVEKELLEGRYGFMQPRKHHREGASVQIKNKKNKQLQIRPSQVPKHYQTIQHKEHSKANIEKSHTISHELSNPEHTTPKIFQQNRAHSVILEPISRRKVNTHIKSKGHLKVKNGKLGLMQEEDRYQPWNIQRDQHEYVFEL